MSKLKKNTKKYEATTLLFKLGGAWKRDYIFALKYLVKGNESQAYRLYNDLLKDGAIVERTIDKYKGKRKANDSCIEVTLNEKSYQYSLETRDRIKERIRKFKSKSNKNLYRALSETRIKIMMHCSEVKVFKKEKPSLITLLDENVKRDDYRPYSYQEWQDIICNCGVFYSSTEVREAIEFLKSKKQKDSWSPAATDNMMQSRIKGIVVKDSSIYFVYIANPRDNKLIKIHNEGEKNYVLQAVSQLREIISISYISINPKAIIISDGDSMVYTSSLGNPSGRIKNIDLLEKQQALNNNYKRSHKGKNPPYSWINSIIEMYDEIYVMPFNYNGVYLLSLLTGEQDAYIKSTKDVLSKYKEFQENYDLEKKKINEIGYLKNTRLIYMQFYEIKKLKKIRDELRVEYDRPYTDKDEILISILTEFEMIDAISHSIGYPAKYYVINDSKLIEIGDKHYQTYDRNGYSKGMNVVKAYVESYGYIASNRLLNSLPKKANEAPIAFWNSVAKGSNKFKELINFDELKTIEEGEKKRMRKKRKTVYMQEKILTKLKEKAKEQGITPNRYIADLIYKDIRSVEESSTE